MLRHLISFLRSRRPKYRPEVVIFTRQWREDLQALQWRLRRDMIRSRDWRRTHVRRRRWQTRDERKPKSTWPTN